MQIKLKADSEFITEIDMSSDSRMRVPGLVFSPIGDVSRDSNEQALQQVVNVAMMQGIAKASIAMPDFHWGYGFPIGGVAGIRMEDGIISPGGVGYDINCGVSLLSTPINEHDFNARKNDLMDSLLRKIPVGMEKSRLRIREDHIESIIGGGLKIALEDGLAFDGDLSRTEDSGQFRVESTAGVSKMARKRGISFIGTLGSGNHFLEVQRVSEIFEPEIARDFLIHDLGQVMVMIHSGSRGLGHQVALEFMTEIQNHPEKISHPVDRQLDSIPLDSEVGQRYINSMNCSANYANYNRQSMISATREAFSKIFPSTDPEQYRLSYGISHNIAREEIHKVNGENSRLMVHRKGATRAFSADRMGGTAFEKFGHPVIVPGDMGTASYVLVGTEASSELSLGSSCHGAGREMSRKKAGESFNPEEVILEMERRGISLRAKDRSAISTEAPGSYKNIDMVVKSVVGAGIARVVARLTPLGVLKG